MTRPEKRVLPLAVALVTGLWAGPAGAACTAIVGKKVQAKNTPKFQVQSKDLAISPAGVDPVTNGVTVTINVNAGTVTYNICSGAEWTGDTTKGWKFKRVACATGIKGAQIKAGKLKVKGDSLGDTGSFPLTVTSDVDVLVASGTTSYSMRFITSEATKNDGSQYLNKNPSLATGIGCCADCCSFTKLRTTTVLPDTTVTVGHVIQDDGSNGLDLVKGGLYFGGAGVGVPLPSLIPNTLPDANGFVGTYTNVTACAAGSYTLTNTSTAQVAGAVHPERHCSSAGVATNYPRTGCLFGPPLAIPNSASSATSTCVINRISTNASGTGTCSGSANISLPLGSDIYLTGPTAGLVPCPLCISGTCSGGPNNGVACVAESSAIPGQSPAANPTSHDCPPAESAFIGTLPIAFGLTPGTQTAVSSTTAGAGTGGVFKFFGFCGQSITPAFENPPHACTADSQCTTGTFTRCRQRTDGAFGVGPAKTITVTGIAPGCLTDGAAHNLTLVSIFGIPPSYNTTVDASADLPGPGESSLPGTTQLLP